MAEYIIPGLLTDTCISARYDFEHFIYISGKDFDKNKSSLIIESYFSSLTIDYKYDADSARRKTQYIDYYYFGGRPYRVIESEPQWVKVLSYKEKDM